MRFGSNLRRPAVGIASHSTLSNTDIRLNFISASFFFYNVVLKLSLDLISLVERESIQRHNEK